MQFYGHTIRGVMADNRFDNANVLHIDQPNQRKLSAAMGLMGECYQGSPAVMWFSEFYSNRMHASDGTTIETDSGTKLRTCGELRGPWVRWVALRGNTISGVSLAAQNASRTAGQTAGCGSVVVALANNPEPPSDVVAEHQTYSCPGEFRPGATNLSICDHCRSRD